MAENPGIDTESSLEIISGRDGVPDSAVELLEEPVASDDIVTADGKPWIVHKGTYAFSEYDHETS